MSYMVAVAKYLAVIFRPISIFLALVERSWNQCEVQICHEMALMIKMMNYTV